jgi:hypothetical protein
MRPRRLTPLLRGAGTRRCARRRGRPARAMRATAACSVARSPGCGSYESANGDVALGAAEPHFFERTLRAFVVDGCRDAIRGAFAARPPGSWKPLPHRQISPEPGAVEVVDVDFEVSDVARRCAGQLFISSKRPAGSIYRRVTRCQAVRARLPFSGRQGKEIGSDGNSNAHGSEGVRRDRVAGATAASIVALNSTAGSSFGDPRCRGQRTGQAGDG